MSPPQKKIPEENVGQLLARTLVQSSKQYLYSFVQGSLATDSSNEKLCKALLPLLLMVAENHSLSLECNRAKKNSFRCLHSVGLFQSRSVS